MDKCEGCPLDLGGKCHYWGYNPDDCAMTESDKELLTDFLAEITGDQVEKRLTPSDMTAIKSAIAEEGRLVTTEDCEKIHAWLDAKLEWSLRDEKIRFGPQVGQDQGGEI